jgi:hypothetical protein
MSCYNANSRFGLFGKKQQEAFLHKKAGNRKENPGDEKLQHRPPAVAGSEEGGQ